MASVGKSQKDKPHPVRLTPRPTAASAARAARIALNRNLTTPIERDLSTRSRAYLSTSPASPKGRSPSGRQAPRPTNSDIKVKSPNTRQTPKLSNSDIKPTDAFIVDDVRSNLTLEANTAPGSITTDNDREESEIFTNESFDIKNSEISIQQDETLPKHDQLQSNETNIRQQHETLESLENNRTPVLTPRGSQSQTPHESQPQTPRGSRPQTPSDSRPQTPLMSSRPLTPKSRPRTPSSRPRTPANASSRTPSQPTTPNQRRVSPASRPSTPQKPTTPVVSRPQTPQSANPILTSNARAQPHLPMPMSCPPVKEEDDIKTVFSTKQRQFQHMKKELDIKQQAILEVFDSLRNLNERLINEGYGGGEGFQAQELVVFNVGDWTSDEVAQLCRDVAASSNSNVALEFVTNLQHIDENSFAEFDAQVCGVPTKFADLCLQAFTARQELIDWVKELIEPMQDGRGESLERIDRYNRQGLELCDTLRELKARADDVVGNVVQISKCVLRERSNLLSVGESLVREVARLQQDLEARAVIVNEMREIQTENETAKVLQDVRRELEEERSARVATKEKLTMTEAQLRQTRIRVTKMERQLREADASIVGLTANVKALEDQSRQREVHLEARARKLKESLKTSEVAHSQIVQQRDALQAEVNNLKEQMEALTSLNKTNVQEMSKEIRELKAELNEQRQQNASQTEKNNLLEKDLAESQAIITELKEKIPDPNDNSPELPTEREIDLWAELQATKETLRMTEDEVIACKREKVRFLETLTKISESENKIGMQQKLAAELLSKEEIIGKMQIQIRELTKNTKLNEQKVTQYEQYVRNLHVHNRAAANCQEAPNGISYQDLQQEIMSLRMKLLDAVHRNEELSELLTQKEQQIEQQDKTSRAQARIIKVREELINMLKNKETEQSRELGAMQQDLEQRMKIVDEVNKQIAAKAEEIQELFVTLENKQQQIHRLEKIVLALEEQQRRAQAQRTRHEEKIAALEHELAATNRRERKFLFF